MNEREEKLLDLLERCDEMAEQGRKIRLDELCAEWGCPELLRELQEQLHLERWAAPQAAPTPEPPTFRSIKPTIPNYEVLEELGRGGMGAVYKARDRLGRFVAVKVIGTELVDTTQRHRFRVEAQALAQLNHPNIVQVYYSDSWEPAEGGPTLPYLVLEYVAGDTLEKRLGCGPANPADAAHLVHLLASAVQHAHNNKIIHRDLKPGNVMLAPLSDNPALNCAWGCPKLTDFGLARRVEWDGLHQPTIHGKTSCKRIRTAMELEGPCYLAGSACQ